MSLHEGGEDINELAGTFRDEASELLVEVESSLLELESNPRDAGVVARLFRALHTLKGSSGMFGFSDVSSFAHALETTFDEVRKGNLEVSPDLVTLSLGAKDQLRAMVLGEAVPAKSTRENLIDALARLRKVERRGTAVSVGPPPRGPVLRTFRIQFRPLPSLLHDGTNPRGLFAELRELGKVELTAHVDEIPLLEELDVETCYVSWDALLTTERDEAAVREVFIFVEDRGELKIELIDDGETGDPEYKKLGRILVERGDIDPSQLESVVAAQPKLGTLLQQRVGVSPSAVDAALKEQRVIREARAGRADADTRTDPSATLRVAAEKLDELVDLVGELVIVQSRLTQIAASATDEAVISVAEDVERLVSALRGNTLNLRMVPIGSTFGRFKRLVRDLASELGKQIELVTEGAETELDKTVIERLTDPLVHLVRNSCDHGVESPEARAAANKPPSGTIRLRAYQSGASVVIEIHDDGGGLDCRAIRAKAVARGLIDPAAEMSEQQIAQLIFLPGLSTAKSLSTVSGRGVGMDVVKRSVEALRGTVEVTSTLGVGTTVRITLPLTLAIIDGLLVAVGEGRYVLPTCLVEECVELTAADVESGHGNELVMVRGEPVPYVHLRKWLHEGDTRPPIEQIAIAKSDGMRLGLVVDEIIGQHQTVIKALGKMYRGADWLAGATILGDGAVALIVDVAGLIRAVTTAAAVEAARGSRTSGASLSNN